MKEKKPQETRIQWKNQYRIISTQYPPINIFEGLCPPELLQDLEALEARTNPRMMQAAGNLTLVEKDDIVTGNGASVVMAAFTHIGNPSRFSDGSFGVYYAAQERQTAIHETVFHRERIARAAQLEPDYWHMRVYVGTIEKKLVDVRHPEFQHYHHPDITKYSIPQAFGLTMKNQRRWGIVYNSVRHAGGQCIAALRPPAISRAELSSLLEYTWDGANVVSVCEKLEPVFTYKQVTPVD